MDRLTAIAKQLRTKSTDAENLMWRHLRAKRLNGFKFRRQEPVGNFIADFICFEKRIVVEVDGGQHALRDSDFERDAWFRGQGFKVLRFWNNDVLGNTEGVLESIRIELNDTPSPLSPPVKGGDRARKKI